MAGVWGHFVKGLGTGFLQGQQIQEMNWQRKEKERIKKEEDALMETLTMAGKKFSSYHEDYNVSEDERLQAISTWQALSYEAKELLKGAYDGVMNYNKEQEEQTLATVKAYRETIEGIDFDLSTIPEISDFFRGQIKSPNGLKYFDAADRILQKNKEALQGQPKLEVFASPDELLKARPGSDWEFSASAGGYIPKQTAAKEPTPLSAKDNWAIDAYKSGQINFDQLSKYMGTYIEPEKATELQKKIAEAKQYGATNEEIKNMLVGGAPTPTPPVPTTTENVREAIKEADTIEDARRINKNYIDKYGKGTLDIDDVDKFWTDSQTSYLNTIFDTINKSIKNLIDEKGHLRKGTVTKEEIGVEFAGEQPAEDVYKLLREEYMKYRDMLEELGVDISQFPELKSLEEIEKVGFWEGFWGWGKQRGQYKSIYK